jgi:TRAP-type C4-dicarboxylate transport system substrate-binding protein
MADIRTAIAKAIKKADRSWFNEDYEKQARSAVQAIRSEGHAIVPLEPSDEAIEAGLEAMQAGRHRPADVLKALYQAMVSAGKV